MKHQKPTAVGKPTSGPLWAPQFRSGRRFQTVRQTKPRLILAIRHVLPPLEANWGWQLDLPSPRLFRTHGTPTWHGRPRKRMSAGGPGWCLTYMYHVHPCPVMCGDVRCPLQTSLGAAPSDSISNKPPSKPAPGGSVWSCWNRVGVFVFRPAVKSELEQ